MFGSIFLVLCFIGRAARGNGFSVSGSVFSVSLEGWHGVVFSVFVVLYSVF